MNKIIRLEQEAQWLQRIKIANDFYKDWDSQYSPKKLADYHRGKQWDVMSQANRPYVLNLIYSTVGEKLSNWLVGSPSFILTPKPGALSSDPDTAVKAASSKQDLLNALIKLPGDDFVTQLRRSLKDSIFGFGVFEVGYSKTAPNPKSPLSLMPHREEATELTKSEETALEIPILPEEEVFFQRIKYWRFRVADDRTEDLNTQPWFGYYFYMNREAFEASDFEKPEDFQIGLAPGDQYMETTAPRKSGALRLTRGIKLWCIWDNLTKKKRIIMDKTGFQCSEEHFERPPIISMRWTEEEAGFYPIPPASQWVPSQVEVNESRQQMRQIRKRSVARWGAIKGMVDVEEVDKFAIAEEPSVVWLNTANAIAPIESPGIGGAIKEAFIIAKDDFNIVSGVSAQERGQVDRTTATQANLIDQANQKREKDQQRRLNQFYTGIGREGLLIAVEKMSRAVWVKLSGIPEEQFLQDFQPSKPAAGQVIPSTLNDGGDFDLELDVIDASPAALAAQKQSFMEFMSLLAQFPMIATSPLLIREAALKVGYRNEKVIAQAQQAALLYEMGKATAQQQQGGGGGGAPQNNFAKRQLAQSTPNTTEEVRSQMNNQLGRN